MNYKSGNPSHGSWTFLTNHAHVLVCIHRNREMPLREIAEEVGITERAAVRIVGELIEAGYLERERIGRHNRYTVKNRLPLRHPLEEHISIGHFLGALDA